MRALRYTTIRHPREVLRLTVQDGDGEAEVLVYKGFSSSLTRPTAPDPDVPVLTPETAILWVDRLFAPYHPETIHYLEPHLSWSEFMEKLTTDGY